MKKRNRWYVIDTTRQRGAAVTSYRWEWIATLHARIKGGPSDAYQPSTMAYLYTTS